METWRPIFGFEETHSVSDNGLIRRDYSARYPRQAPHLLKSYVAPNGYAYIWLQAGIAHRWHVPIHVVVAEAFLGPRPVGKVVNHKDGNKLNNSADNLEWVTASENNTHALRNGLRHSAAGKRGTASPRAKITEDAVLTIRTSKEPLRVLAARYGIGISQTSRIRNGESWGHL